MEATEREVRVSFMQLSRIYHPDKHKPEQTELTQRDAIEKFQLINNAHSYLVKRM
jgi:DnaJ-class molecular chaperone